MRRADRLFQIVQQLRGHQLTTARELAEALEVSQRTIYRDIADLVASGTPIEGEAGVGYVLARGFDVPPLMFTTDELEALWLGAQVVKSWGDPELARAAEQALGKVDAVLPEPLRRQLREPVLRAPQFELHRDRARWLSELRRAIRGRRKVAIAYQKTDGEPEARQLWPLGLFFWGQVWTLAAWCELRQDYRTFRLDRIASLRTLLAQFEPQAERSIGHFLATVAGTSR